MIAAGSTGSIPATAELLKVIAGLPNGAVVLPGLDQMLDEEGWAAIGDPLSEKAVDGHPQFGMKHLIATIGILRQDVMPLVLAPRAIRVRSKLASEALRPAETTEHWAAFKTSEAAPRAFRAALAGIDLIEARHEQEEALAIAIAIREALENSAASIAVVTPDRALGSAGRGRAGPVGARDRRFRRAAARPPGRRASSRACSSKRWRQKPNR